MPSPSGQAADRAPSAPQPETLYLGICPRGGLDELHALNRRIQAAQRPLSKDVVVFAAARTAKEALTEAERARAQGVRFPQDQLLHVTRWQEVPATRAPFVHAALGVFLAAEQQWQAVADAGGGDHAGAGAPRARAARGLGVGAAATAGSAVRRGAGAAGALRADSLDGRARARLAVVSQASAGLRREIYNHVRSLEVQAAQAARGAGAAAAATTAAASADEIRQEAALYAGVHSVWHLAHILFFDDYHATGGGASGMLTTTAASAAAFGGRQQSAAAAASAHDGKTMLEDLKQWLALNHTHDIQGQFEEIVAMVNPTSHPNFWTYIFKCLLRGQFDAATTMLELLPAYKTSDALGGGRLGGMPASLRAAVSATSTSNPVEALKALVKSMPLASAAASAGSVGGGSAQFQQRRMAWKEDVLFVFSDGRLSPLLVDERDRRHFETAFGIVAGVEATILEASTTWQEAFVALGMFVYPQLQGSDVQEMLAAVAERFAPTALLDRVQLALLEMDIPKAIRFASTLDWWLATHLVELFDKSGLLGDFEAAGTLGPVGSFGPGWAGGWAGGNAQGRDECTLSEWYRLAYADYLTSEPTLWRAALEYYASCARHGAEMLEALVPRIPLDSDVKARKLLAFCEAQARRRGGAGAAGLRAAKRQLHRVIARRAMAGGRLGEAIAHYLDGGQGQAVTALCNRLLGEYLTSGDARPFNAVVDSLHPSVVFRHERVAFLARYRDLHKLYEAQSYVQAGGLLIMLLSSNAAPRAFWRALLLDAIPLLEGEVVVFSVEDTFELMRCLEEVSARGRRSGGVRGAPTSGSGPGEADEALDVLRLALTRNLSRAMV
ncbi:Nucleoporin nup85 [Polyrhizophydium stewartii]|uniref:Nuclear pore complex protein Nup85 n=1 Tax=Polyrhizophydium stewartii TaxID=2732419 RepID=A0ABR4N6U0_9FUNG